MSFGSLSGGDEKDETEAGQVAPGGQEASYHFYRKRKRGYFRAYDRGNKTLEVLKFIGDDRTRKMLNGMATQMWSSTLKDSIQKPLGLMDLISNFELSPKGKLIADSDHMIDSLRYALWTNDSSLKKTRWEKISEIEILGLSIKLILKRVSLWCSSLKSSFLKIWKRK